MPIIKRFTQFVNEANDESSRYFDTERSMKDFGITSDLSNSLQEHPNFGYLSDDQVYQIIKKYDPDGNRDLAEIMSDWAGEVFEAMQRPIVDKIDLAKYEEEADSSNVFFDVTVDLPKSTYTVWDIYNASATSPTALPGKLGIRDWFNVYEKFEIPELPITLSIPKIFYEVVEGREINRPTYERPSAVNLTDSEMAELKEWINRIFANDPSISDKDWNRINKLMQQRQKYVGKPLKYQDVLDMPN
jgi:hypothetical protein